MSSHRAEVPVSLRMEAWMQIEDPDLSVEDAVAQLREAGNQILEVDVPGRRIKVADHAESLQPDSASWWQRLHQRLKLEK